MIASSQKLCTSSSQKLCTSSRATNGITIVRHAHSGRRYPNRAGFQWNARPDGLVACGVPQALGHFGAFGFGVEGRKDSDLGAKV